MRSWFLGSKIKELTYVLCLVLLLGSAEARTWSDKRRLFNSNNNERRVEERSNEISEQDALSLYSHQQKENSFASCENIFPGRRPISLGIVPPEMKTMALCSDHFAVLYSQTSKTPIVVVERLSSDDLAKAKRVERSEFFFPDPRIPKSGRAELSDYRGQSPSVDRGHQSPAADSPNKNGMVQSFSLSNIVPQDPVNNRKIWSKIESDVRKFVRRSEGNVFVFTGPIFDRGFAMVGKNRVWKPTRLFKLVYDEASGRAWAYILPNGVAKIDPPVSYANFVSITGLRLLEGS